MPTPDATTAALPPLADALQAASVQPLWDRYQRITTREPAGHGAAAHWPWATMAPLVGRALREVPMSQAERRVLLLTNPAFGAATATTTNLLAGLQMLLPGERATPHRHALQAIRFVMQGGGAETTVNDEVCPMDTADLVLTPAWCWHEHRHGGDAPVVWFDGLDLPLAAHLDAMFFETPAPGRDAIEPAPVPPSRGPVDGAVLRPDAADASAASRSRFRYAGERALAALAAAAPRADGSRRLRYVDASGQGPVLPTLDCYLLAPSRAAPAVRERSTGNAVCAVVRGEGVSDVGGRRVDWRRHDVFTLPHWSWVTHQALSDDAVLFLMTDRELLATMGYLRDEVEAMP